MTDPLDPCQLAPWLNLTLSLIPLLNWLTIVAGAALLGRELAILRIELRLYREADARRGAAPATMPPAMPPPDH